MVVPIPELNAIFTSSSVVAKQIFVEYWSYLVLALGLFFGTAILIWFYNKILGVFDIVLEKKSNFSVKNYDHGHVIYEKGKKPKYINYD